MENGYFFGHLIKSYNIVVFDEGHLFQVVDEDLFWVTGFAWTVAGEILGFWVGQDNFGEVEMEFFGFLVFAHDDGFAFLPNVNYLQCLL